MEQSEEANQSNPEGFHNSGEEKRQEETLSHILRDVEDNPETLLLFEFQLTREELLPGLEQARIVPRVVNPNPYNTDDEMDQHEKWWKEHPEASDTFLNLIGKRAEVLKIMYIGARIGSGSWKIP